jgi:hypothetical protein
MRRMEPTSASSRFLYQFQELFQLRHQIAVVASGHHGMNQAGVGGQICWSLSGRAGIAKSPRHDRDDKYTTLVPDDVSDDTAL